MFTLFISGQFTYVCFLFSLLSFHEYSKHNRSLYLKIVAIVSLCLKFKIIEDSYFSLYNRWMAFSSLFCPFVRSNDVSEGLSDGVRKETDRVQDSLY